MGEIGEHSVTITSSQNPRESMMIEIEEVSKSDGNKQNNQWGRETEAPKAISSQVGRIKRGRQGPGKEVTEDALRAHRDRATGEEVARRTSQTLPWRDKKQKQRQPRGFDN